MKRELEGGCLCGNVRFTGSAAPEFTFYCHCNDCQRTGGSPFSVELMLSSESFDVRGVSQKYTVVGDSGKEVHRHFCPKCGSGIYLTCDADPGYVFVKAGALDDAAWVRPDMHIFTAVKQPWVEVSDTLPRHDRMPPA